MKILQGGWNILPEDLPAINVQKSLTKKINDQLIQVGAIFLKPASKFPVSEEWSTKQRGDTDLQGWVDVEDLQQQNVGFNLQFGWMDVDIDAEPITPNYNDAIVAAFRYLGLDTRFAFGRLSVGRPTHMLIQLSEDDASLWDTLKKLEPKQITLNGARFKTQLRSNGANVRDETAMQTVMPGSLYMPKVKGLREYDLAVWYGKDGVASNVTDIAETTPHRTSFSNVVRAITFGTIAFLLEPYWVEGSRQSTMVTFGGLLNRIVRESESINNHAQLSGEVFCPIDTDSWAEKLIHFLCDYFGDSEKTMRARAYYDARDKLDRNPDAKIPGWPAFTKLVGAETTQAFKTVLMPGSDVSVLTQMAEQYLLDRTDSRYIDRKRHMFADDFMLDGAMLDRQYKDEVVLVGNKALEAFKIFEKSKLRKKVDGQGMYPDHAPGEIFRVDNSGAIVADEDEDGRAHVFNTWRGWPIAPAPVADHAVLNTVTPMVRQLLGYLTRGNEEQIDWILDWISHIIQSPGDKAQIAWVVVGGQGVGKSFFGNTFMKALMGHRLWGAAAPKTVEGNFSVEPFNNKMFVFIDEAKFHTEASVDEIKKLIRNTDVGGEQKYIGARTYKIHARLMFASNRTDVNAGQRNTTDRALFYTRAIDQEHLGMTEMQFRKHTETLKPFFDDFAKQLKKKTVIAQLMRFFADRPINKHTIESIILSSGQDAEIVANNMLNERRIAISILESGWIIDQSMMIESPFTLPQMAIRIEQAAKDLGLGRTVQTDKVMAEFHPLMAKTFGKKFGYRYGDLIRLYSEAVGLALTPCRPLTDDDYGTNDLDKPKSNPHGKRSIYGEPKF